jgi:hypothetical protein
MIVKKILITVVLCLVMVGLMAAPVMAKPNVAFDTGFEIGGATLAGSLDAGFKFVPGATDALLDAKLVAPTATPALADGMYPFYLRTNMPEAAKLTAYFAAKGWPQVYLDQIAAEINGTKAFFYLKAANGVYTLVDGFVYGLSGGTGTTLRINDDYPSGNYMYTGTLKNVDGLFGLNVKLKVAK